MQGEEIVRREYFDTCAEANLFALIEQSNYDWVHVLSHSEQADKEMREFWGSASIRN